LPPSTGTSIGGKAAFQQDELLQGWFVRNLQILGEAARSLPEEVRAATPEVSWPKIIGMRNVLVHGYFDIDSEIVWQAVTSDLPGLRAAIEALLQKIPQRNA
jgi:uncharacterized protein with HEPN domain